MTQKNKRPQTANQEIFDVIVVGSGNAALCAAISASQQGCSVIVLEKAPLQDRGGNSSLTLNMRFAYNSLDDVIPLLDNLTEEIVEALAQESPSYTEVQYYSDLMKVTGGKADPRLAQLLASKSLSTMQWMRKMGQSWVYKYNPLAGSLYFYMNNEGYGHQQRAFFIAEKLGIKFIYKCTVYKILLDEKGVAKGVLTVLPSGQKEFLAKTVILTCGGFEANRGMRSKYLGAKWGNVHVRGIPFNTGDGIEMATQIGAMTYGSWNTCHASPQDSALPPFSLPETYKENQLYARYFYPFGVTVNREGIRFIDEAEDVRNLTYARLGKAILHQEESVAFQIFDSKTSSMFLPYYKNAKGVSTNSIHELAARLNIRVDNLVYTIQNYNKAISQNPFQPRKLDRKGTVGIYPPKSNWALPIDTPPYYGYKVICGLTFTFGGLKINDKAEVLNVHGRPIRGLYAAGEIVGGLFYDNYPGGSGMMSGSVFGKIAGESAAEFAKSLS